MGDSYVSGPGINAIIPSSGGCLRSDHNWPHLLAKLLKVREFHDVSCAGATTDDLVADVPAPEGRPAPAQVTALGPNTRLVTISIGGNDLGVFGGIITSCLPRFNVKRDACSPFVHRQLPGLLGRVRLRISHAIEVVHAKSPRARVVVVGYLRVLPDRTSCRALGIATPQVNPAAKGERALAETLRAAARASNAEFISIRDFAKGHDVCAGTKAWVNGIHAPEGDGVILHPNAAGMRAVAIAVARSLTSSAAK